MGLVSAGQELLLGPEDGFEQGGEDDEDVVVEEQDEEFAHLGAGVAVDGQVAGALQKAGVVGQPQEVVVSRHVRWG